MALLTANGQSGQRTVGVEALTRGRRRLKIRFEVKSLAGEMNLLRLLDGGAREEEPAQPEAVAPQAVADPEEPAEDSDAAAAARRLDFLAKVSHEVRTPLNSILGFTELMLEERLGAIGNARYKSYVEDIHQSGLYALSLLNDLLDISKIDAGKFDLDFTAVDLTELIETCVGSLQPLAKRERILLRTSLAFNLPAVIADRRRLKQILLNLLSNAIKFTNAGGQVIVSARLIDGGDLRLRVHDTGVGMTEEEIAAAMQPFQQLDTAPRRQSGTGLGLPVTKALVDANRARLTIASERGVGTSADVIFPKDRLTAP
jgi:signal transduction histidine kinase